MLILILIDVQHSQKAVFGLERGSNCQNHSSSGSLHLAKKSPTVKFPIPLHPLPLFGKPYFASVPKQKNLLTYATVFRRIELPNQMDLFGKRTWEGCP